MPIEEIRAKADNIYEHVELLEAEVGRLQQAQTMSVNTFIEAKINTAKRCAEIARNGCLVPPDGGSPTPEEANMCDAIAKDIKEEFGL